MLGRSLSKIEKKDRNPVKKYAGGGIREHIRLPLTVPGNMVGKFADVACAGPLLADELEALGKALKEPARPMVAIVGGSKVSTKLTVLAKSLTSPILNTFVAAQGHNVGKSL